MEQPVGPIRNGRLSWTPIQHVRLAFELEPVDVYRNDAVRRFVPEIAEYKTIDMDHDQHDGGDRGTPFLRKLPKRIYADPANAAKTAADVQIRR